MAGVVWRAHRRVCGPIVWLICEEGGINTGTAVTEWESRARGGGRGGGRGGLIEMGLWPELS